jgi:SM-20-related protein
VTALRADLLARRDQLDGAAIGRGGQRQVVSAVRTDRIHWLDGSSPAQRAFLADLEALRLALNRALLLGLFEYEAHYALYPPGARYLRHYDAFRGGNRRILSTVFYLNEGWAPGDGGELRLWRADERELATLAPLAGRALLFLSEEFPHEVLPARRDRLSIAGWFRARDPAAPL